MPSIQFTKTLAVSVTASDWFQDPAFIDWLNSPTTTTFTWHSTGEAPGEYSDVVVAVDPSLNGEGSDGDMPTHIWKQIIQVCRDTFSPNQSADHILVRIKPA